MTLKVIFVVLGIVSFAMISRFSIMMFAYRIRTLGRAERPKPSDVAIILGAYTDGYRPSAPLMARLRAGLDLYRRGFMSYVIVSGGQGEDETVSESRSMKRFLVFNGVPPTAILEDRLSSDTWENLVNSQQVMERHGYTTAIIVTSDYHLPRALAVASQLGMNVSGFAAWSKSDEFTYAKREVIARIQYTLKGRAALRRGG